MLSCGSDEDTTYKTPPIDPSEPIVVATVEPIDFEAEKNEINQVYAAFYSAFNKERASGIDVLWKNHPVHAQFSVAWVAGGEVEPTGLIAGWSNIKANMESLWNAQGAAGERWTGSNRFSQFWIRRKLSDPNTLEASARASASYRSQEGSGETYAYLVKPAHENWQIQQLQSATRQVINKGRGDVEITKYFTDPSAEAP